MLTTIKEWKGGDFIYEEAPYTIELTCSIIKDGSFYAINGNIRRGHDYIASISSDIYKENVGSMVLNVSGLTIENRIEVNTVIDNCIEALKTKFEIK